MPPVKVVVTPAKLQKNLFSFFQKTERPVTVVGKNTDASGAEAVAAAAGVFSQFANLVTPSPSTPLTQLDEKATSHPVATPIKVQHAGDADSDSDFSLARKARKRTVPIGSSKPQSGTSSNKAKKPKANDDSEEEWMESSASEANDDDNESLSLSASDDEDDFIVDDDDEDEKGNGRKGTKTHKNIGKQAKKPPLARKETPSKTSGGYALIMDANNTPAKSQPAPFTPTWGSSNPLLASTPGGSASPAHAASSTPMTTSTGQNIQLPEGVVGRGSHEHNSFPFLQPENRRDLKGRRPEDPQYNPRTLFVPDAFLRDQTPAMSQWWHFKARNMDTVLFFKVGKFYELFHMDADVGFSELDLIYMKGSKAHSGFPEISYGKFASTLVSKGYRVARVEQTETPEMLKERNDASGKGKKDKVVNREVCSVMTRGTRTFCHLDDLSLLEDGKTLSMVTSILLSIKESVDAQGVREYGLCAVDSVVGTVTLAQFQDDDQLSRLRTFLARFDPSEILLEENAHSQETFGVVRLVCPQAILDKLKAKEEMLEAAHALEMIRKAKYFTDPTPTSAGKEGKEEVWPTVLAAVAAGLQDGSSALVLSALGGALWQLRRSLIDYEVLSMGKFFAYVPPDSMEEVEHAKAVEKAKEKGGGGGGTGRNQASAMAVEGETEGDHKISTMPLHAHTPVLSCPMPSTPDQEMSNKSLILDEMALTNLEVLANTYDKTEVGSLWAFVNRAKTACGRRLLRSWLCHPLFHVNHILARRAAVEELLSVYPQEAESCRNLLRQVPDLERLLSRVHSNGLLRLGSADHPDNRAVMYESAVHNMRKIRDFADLLTGFEVTLRATSIFRSLSLSSSLLRKLLPHNSTGSLFPLTEMKELLDYFRSIFDERQAKRDGNIKPHPGINPDYDQAVAEVTRLTQGFEQYLVEMKRTSGISDIKYYASNKDRFQLEVPMNLTSRVPADWTSKSQKKTHRRYWTPKIEKMLANLVAAEERVEVAQKDTLRSIFARFDKNRNVWDRAVSFVSQLDALLALATVSSLPGYSWPHLLSRDASQSPELSIVGGRHPMLEHALAQRGDGDFIPNDLSLGGTNRTACSMTSYRDFNARLLLLTGPNMGGKSTLLRQTCLLVILAQMGCKVPASSMTLTPVDRIFTRIGASDRIMHGQSTFFVELAETAMILQAATEDSLCILDELGRGTATFDGTAVAHSVVHHLVSQKRCRTLFATHYHLLIEDWEVDPRVKLGHMDCIVQTEERASAEKKSEYVKEEVTFLYKLCDGASPKSYGIHVAQLAGVPEEILALAQVKSWGMEAQTHAMLRGETRPADCRLNTDTSSTLTRREYLRRASAVFDALVSIFEQNQEQHRGVRLADEEFVYLVAELWKRFESYKLHVQK